MCSSKSFKSSLLSDLFIAQSDSRIFWKFEFLFHEDSQYIGVLKIVVYGNIVLPVYNIDYKLRS